MQSLPINDNSLSIPTNSFDNLEFFIYAYDLGLEKEAISPKITYTFKFDCSKDIIVLKENSMTILENEVGTSMTDFDVSDKFENNEACEIIVYRID